jgi:hypothetical protein
MIFNKVDHPNTNLTELVKFVKHEKIAFICIPWSPKNSFCSPSLCLLASAGLRFRCPGR